jgi:hypothetical protein
LHVADFERPDGSKVAARPVLDNNNFRANTLATVAAGTHAPGVNSHE